MRITLRRIRLTAARAVNGVRLAYAKLRRPGSGHTQDDVPGGESDSLTKVQFSTSLDIDAKAKLHVIASFWGVPMGEVLNRLVTQTFDEEAPGWPPKTLSRRLKKYANKEWQALSRKGDRREGRQHAGLLEQKTRFDEIQQRLKSPSQAEREAALVDMLKLVKETRDRRGRRPRRRG